MSARIALQQSALSAVLLVGCASAPEPPAPTSEPAPVARASTAPFMPVATVLELMESVIAHAAEEYWGAVLVVVDETGETEDYPETDEEWEEVWAAAMSIAESGNLLMMAPRAVDNGAGCSFRHRWSRSACLPQPRRKRKIPSACSKSASRSTTSASAATCATFPSESAPARGPRRRNRRRLGR